MTATSIIRKFPETSYQEDPGIPYERIIKQVIARAIKASTKSREQIAEEISFRVGSRISPSMLNAFTAESRKDVRFPAAWVSALCEVTGNHELERLVLSHHSRALLTWAERNLSVAREENHLDAAREELLKSLEPEGAICD